VDAHNAKLVGISILDSEGQTTAFSDQWSWLCFKQRVVDAREVEAVLLDFDQQAKDIVHRPNGGLIDVMKTIALGKRIAARLGVPWEGLDIDEGKWSAVASAVAAQT
jgi:hypothetical protein